MKVKEIIKWAFAEVVQSSSEPTPAEQIAALRYLNRMMARLANKGMDVGYTRRDSLEAEASVPDSAILAMVKNLAVNLWTQYNTDPINPILQFSADRTLKTLQAYAVNIDQAAQFPDTFPVGSGNSDGIYVDQFYTNDQGQTKYIAGE